MSIEKPSQLDLLIYLFFEFTEVSKANLQGIVELIYEKTNVYLDEDKYNETWTMIYTGTKYYYRGLILMYPKFKIMMNKIVDFINSYNLKITDIVNEYRNIKHGYCIHNSSCCEKGFEKCFQCKKFKIKKIKKVDRRIINDYCIYSSICYEKGFVKCFTCEDMILKDSYK